MFEFFKRKNSVEKKKRSTVDVDDDGIRYPPFIKGLPVYSVDKIIATQNHLIERIRTSLGFTDEKFDLLVMPVIQRYAEYVHLLPASERNHHRGMGGLLRHGLEVAFWATQASEGVMFTIDGSPLDRRNNEPKWRLAACLSGLLHDAGKPITDIRVYCNDSSGPAWVPGLETIPEWSANNNVKNYSIQWRAGRHQKHEKFAHAAAEKLLPNETMRYINNDDGAHIMLAMVDAITRTNLAQPLTRLTQKADEQSVNEDLKKNNFDAGRFEYAVPVDIFVTDAIRTLINTGKWVVNQPGSKVWFFEQGAFIAWRQIEDLYKILDRDDRKGVPRDADLLADILIDRNFAIENTVTVSGVARGYRYWDVMPEILQLETLTSPIRIAMLRIADHNNIFTVNIPEPIKARISGEAEENFTFEGIDDDENKKEDAAGAHEKVDTETGEVLPSDNDNAEDVVSDSAADDDYVEFPFAEVEKESEKNEAKESEEEIDSAESHSDAQGTADIVSPLEISGVTAVLASENNDRHGSDSRSAAPKEKNKLSAGKGGQSYDPSGPLKPARAAASGGKGQAYVPINQLGPRNKARKADHNSGQSMNNSGQTGKNKNNKKKDQASPESPALIKTERNADIYPSGHLTAKKAMILLRSMIDEGQGRWLVTPVQRDGDFLFTSDKALEMIVAENIGLSKSALRGASAYRGLKLRGGFIYAKVDDEH